MKDLRKLEEIWAKFVYEGEMDPSVQPAVAEGWRRCRAAGVNPIGGRGRRVDDEVFRSIREANAELIDVAMPISYVRKDLVEELKLLEPFGKGNSRPVFAQKNIRPVGCRILGKNRSVVKMKLMDEWGGIIDGVYFGDGDGFVSQIREKGAVDVVYYPTIDRWQGRESLQAVITHFQ